MSQQLEVVTPKISLTRTLIAAICARRIRVRTMEELVLSLQQHKVVARYDASSEDVERILRGLHSCGVIQLGQYVEESGRHRRIPVTA